MTKDEVLEIVKEHLSQLDDNEINALVFISNDNDNISSTVHGDRNMLVGMLEIEKSRWAIRALHGSQSLPPCLDGE